MIVIVVKQPVRSKFADDFNELVREFTEATRAEPGNISFDWYRDPEDPKLWIGVEVFEDNNTGYLVYACETGAIAVVAKK